MFEKIEYLIATGINISFKTHTNGAEITMEKNVKSERVVLPDDHLTESTFLRYINLMENKLNS